MIKLNSKRKGSNAERELCAFLTGEGFPATRNDQRYTGGHGNPDISAERLDAYHIEVKRTERLRLGEAMRQAEHDAAGRVPCVVHRSNRAPWLITLHLTDWLDQQKERDSF